MASFRYPRPGLTVDAVIVARPQASIPPQLLLIKRKFEPCKDQWALPGGFVEENESLDVAAARELQEETSVDPSSVLLTQVCPVHRRGDIHTGISTRGWAEMIMMIIQGRMMVGFYNPHALCLACTILRNPYQQFCYTHSSQ